jgi:hypothetical protein
LADLSSFFFDIALLPFGLSEMFLFPILTDIYHSLNIISEVDN